MNTKQKGLGLSQLLLVTVVFVALSFIVGPEYQAPAISDQAVFEKALVAEALEVAGASRHEISEYFSSTRALPRGTREADALRPDHVSLPEFVREVKLQHDRDGKNILVMVYLSYGAVENILGGEQYLYYAGLTSGEAGATLNWECGARNIDLNLLPADCQN